MRIFSISKHVLDAKTALVSAAGVESRRLQHRLCATKSKPSDRTWRVVTLKDGTEFVTRTKYSALARKFMGIRRAADEEGKFLERQKATVEYLYQQLGGEDLRAAQAYFSSSREVADSAAFRRTNQVLAKAQGTLAARQLSERQTAKREAREAALRAVEVPRYEKRIAAMRQLRTDLLQLRLDQWPEVPHLEAGDALAKELDALVDLSSPATARLTPAQTGVLREHVAGVARESRRSAEEVVESMLLRLPTARLLSADVFNALVDYYEELVEQRLQARLAQ